VGDVLDRYMKTDVLIIGAGITGLACAHYLKRDYIVFEKQRLPGGVCQTDKIKGFYFDRAEHFIRVPDEKILGFFKRILGSDFYPQKLFSSIYYDDRFIPYPFQKNIYYLSNKDKLDCFKSFVSRPDNGKVKKYSSFGDWALKNYGEWICVNFIFPYNKKIWRADPFRMKSDFSFDPKLIPRISFDQMLEYTFLKQEDRREDHVQHRYYLKTGGIGAFSDKLASKVKNIAYGKDVVKIDLKQKEAVCSDGTACGYNAIVSTIPLVELVKMIKGIPARFKKMARGLKYNSICVYNFALNKDVKLRYHWIYVPQRDAPMVRIYLLKNFNSKMCPKGKSSFSAIYAYMPNSRIDHNKIEKRIVNYLSERAFLSADDIEFKFRQIIKYAMPIPTIGSDNIVKRLDKFLLASSVKTIGRYGQWKYQGIEHAVRDGQNINSILKRSVK